MTLDEGGRGRQTKQVKSKWPRWIFVTAAIAVVLAVALALSAWRRPRDRGADAAGITVVESTNPPAGRLPRRAPAVPPATLDPAVFSAAFADGDANPGDAFDWQEEALAVPGYPNRTAPPTTAGGGFYGAPDAPPLIGNALDVP